MKLLWLHNHYKVHGGESAAADREARLLREAGVEVRQETAHNDAIDAMGGFERALLPFRNAWSRSSYRRVRELCQEFRPDILHAHNVWPLLSPAVFAAARAEGVPTVFTAHNFYLFCLNGVFFRDGKICTDCVGHLPWAGVRHRCYRGVVGSVTRFAGTALHRLLGTFRKVDRILTPTEFARQQFLDAGFDPRRVRAKWLSCEDPLPLGAAPSPLPASPSFLVACRLVPEKGVQVLVDAVRASRGTWRLRIAGDGPERERLMARTAESGIADRIEFLGHVSPDAMRTQISASTAMLIPSIWYETFGLTAIEAFAAGRPVVASDLGALREVVTGDAGFRVPPGDALAWARSLDELAVDRGRADSYAAAARRCYDEHFTPQRDAVRLLDIYGEVIGRPVGSGISTPGSSSPDLNPSKTRESGPRTVPS